MKGSILYAGGLIATALLGFIPTAAPAQQRIRQLIIYGNDRCPTNSSGEEIVVCSRRPENERYRIPPNVREDGDNSPERQSWANRARSLQNVGNVGTDSCTTVGAGGQTGCLKRMIDASQGDEAANAPNGQPQ
jgi:hypothetical protein